MARFIRIDTDIVVEVAEFDSIEGRFHPDLEWHQNDAALIGWLRDERGGFAPPEPPAPTVPQSVTMRQARLALLQAGLLAQVDTAIDQLPEPDKTAARIEWEYSQEVQRDKPFVAMLALALGLDGEALDALFVHAETL